MVRSSRPPFINPEKARLRSSRQRQLQDYDSSSRSLNIKAESWTDFHKKHRSSSSQNSSEFLFQRGGCGSCGENTNWFFDFLGSLLCGHSMAVRPYGDDDSHSSAGSSRSRRRHRKGNIRIDSIAGFWEIDERQTKSNLLVLSDRSISTYRRPKTSHRPSPFPIRPNAYIQDLYFNTSTFYFLCSMLVDATPRIFFPRRGQTTFCFFK
jgi:hypothetical protein